MLDLRKFDSLGRFSNDWLTARHHFSFGNYFDPARGGVGALLVWNDDTIEPGTGFDLHGHRDMEIITYVRKGAITHRDHLGNEGRTEAGDVQVMSAGKGIMHAEYNLEDEETQIFQIWIRPNQQGVTPRWEQRAFPKSDRSAGLQALASGRGEHPDALPIHQDAAVLAANLEAGQTVDHEVSAGRVAYLVPASGRVTAKGMVVEARDGLAIVGPETLGITAEVASEVILVDAPGT